MRGEAADIVAYRPTSDVGPSTGSGTLVSTEENKRLGQLIEELGNFDQLIYEQCDKTATPDGFMSAGGGMDGIGSR